MTNTDSYCMIIENGKIRTDNTSIADLADFFQILSNQSQPSPLVLHFHGGLVSKKKGIEIAQRLTDSCYGPARAHPAFFIWESHPIEIIRNNLAEIAQESVFRLVLKHVAQFAQAKIGETLGARGQRLELPSDTKVWDEIDLLDKGGIPFNSIDPAGLPQNEGLSPAQMAQFEERLRQDNRLNTETQKIAAALLPEDQSEFRSGRVQASTSTLMSSSVLDEIRREKTSPQDRGLLSTARIIKGAVIVLKNVILRFVTRRDHGFFPTIVEETLKELYLANAGKFIWDLMKKDTEDAFRGHGESNEETYGGTAFLKHLSRAWTQGCRPRIVLVGHSTGAIFICNLLKAANTQHLPPDIRFDTVFLAPAVRFDLFADTLVHHGDRIAGFRSFGLEDQLERSDKLLSILYPRSLLYLVSGILESEVDCPLVGMQRYYSRQTPFDPNAKAYLKQVIDYMDKDANHLVWSPSDVGPGLSSGSTRHSDFDNDAGTLGSLQTILQKGF